jgi:ABC-type multidrug transport system ATPase subunit
MKIELRNVSKSYGRVHALEDVTLNIEPGQIISLLGVNGAGKTTFLRCLSGITVPDRGDVLFDGERFRRSKTELRQRLHFLPDVPFFYPRMSVLQHIGLVAKAYEKTEAGTEHRVVELLEEFDLLPMIKSSIAKLSRGQQYKVALIAMMIADPELWLFDEPFASGMDPLGLAAFRRLVRDAAKRGRTVIYSTQLLELAESFSDRVCVINGGRIHAFDTMFNLTESSQAAPGAVLEHLFSQLRDTTEL